MISRYFVAKRIIIFPSLCAMHASVQDKRMCTVIFYREKSLKKAKTIECKSCLAQSSWALLPNMAFISNCLRSSDWKTHCLAADVISIQESCILVLKIRVLILCITLSFVMASVGDFSV